MNCIPKVSVVMPVYNTKPFLRMCLESVINQTLREIQIICVDDGSTDGSLDILREYEKRDPRIIVVVQPNINAGAARNRGLTYATGEYLSFLDSDDYFECNMLENAYTKAKEHSAEVVIFRSDAYDIDSDQYIEQRYTIRRELLPDHEPFAGIEVKRDFFKAFVGWAWDKLFLRDYIRENKIRFQEQRTTNDLFFTFIALSNAKRIVTLEDLLVHHRTHIKSSLEATRGYSWDCFYWALLLLREGLKNNGVYIHYERDYINYCLHFSLWHLNRLAEPYRKHLYDRLKNEWFQQFGVTTYPKRQFYHWDEYLQYTLIMAFPYNGVEQFYSTLVAKGKKLIRKVHR